MVGTGQIRYMIESFARHQGCNITFGQTGKEPTREELWQWQNFYICNMMQSPRDIGKDDLDDEDNRDIKNGKSYYLLQLMHWDQQLPLMLYARSESSEQVFNYAQYDNSVIKLNGLQREERTDMLPVKVGDVEYAYAPIIRYNNDKICKYVYPREIPIGPLKGHEKLIVKMEEHDWNMLIAPFERVSMAGNGAAIARSYLNGNRALYHTDPRNLESIVAAAECLREIGGLPSDTWNSWKAAASVVTHRVPELPRGLTKPFLKETARLFMDVNLHHGRREEADDLAFLLNRIEPERPWTMDDILRIASRII